MSKSFIFIIIHQQKLIKKQTNKQRQFKIIKRKNTAIFLSLSTTKFFLSLLSTKFEKNKKKIKEDGNELINVKRLT